MLSVPKLSAIAATILLTVSQAIPTEIPADISTNTTSLIEARGCSSSNTGTHCENNWSNSVSYYDQAVNDLMSQCVNGNFPGGAKRVTSGNYGGFVAYACNGFCRTQYMPCQDAAWSIARVKSSCYNSGRGEPYNGWDSQETRGTWYGVTYQDDKPCGYAYSGRGASYP